MEYSQVIWSKEAQKSLATENQRVKTQGLGDEHSVYVQSPLEESLDLALGHAFFIASQNTKKATSILEEVQAPDGIHIFTIVADCRFLYNAQIAMSINNFLLKEGYISEEQKQKLQLLVHETLLNAIEYGNLDMAGEKARLLKRGEWHEPYYAKVKKRLSDSAWGARPIIIQCSLNNNLLNFTIEDDGRGFDSEKKITELEAKSAPDKPYAMGLLLMRQTANNYNFDKNGTRATFSIKTNFNQSTPSISGIKNLLQQRKEARILVIDDQKTNRELVSFYLRKAGFSNVHLADGALSAIHLMNDGLMPDIILLDIIMPDMDGFTFCRRLKQSPATRRIPILFMSGLSDSINRVKGYRFGAVDYVNKPIHKDELIARTEIHLDHSLIFKAVEDYSQRVSTELERAKKVQCALMPNDDEIEKLSTRHKTEISYEYEASEELAGDYWSVIDIDDKNIGIILADFTGHGVAASLNTIRLHALVNELSQYHMDPVEFTSHLNTRLTQHLSLGDFATFVYGVLNTETGHLTYVGCGSPSITVIPKDLKKKQKQLDCSGLPVGLQESCLCTFEKREATLDKGDTLLLYSDALNEALHEDGKMWLDDGIESAVQKIRKAKQTPKVEELLSIFRETAVQPLTDDLTVLMVTY